MAVVGDGTGQPNRADPQPLGALQDSLPTVFGGGEAENRVLALFD